MEPSNLSALKEEEEEDETSVGGGDQVRHAPSAFSPDSIPPRPASQSSLQKYAPLDWSDYFDKEDDVKVPGSDNTLYGDSPPAVILVGHRYDGLSEMFLSCPVPKLLLLAGTDRLDRSLTIGQMQGKFQMVVVRHTGHAIQEDVPDEFASLIINFISRNRIGPNGVEEQYPGSTTIRGIMITLDEKNQVRQREEMECSGSVPLFIAQEQKRLEYSMPARVNFLGSKPLG
ncbi:hypothetical protein MUK42_33581 [Musa troglodytarum]|uniref:Protein phosphatase methylesterase-1 n=1 Tax=Musa troglodytarum TaxID=320322 RepID=A0A9E7FCX1_9LILI|nr:hypothetical protein MUK42_33581 [Musa troglodytarum]